MVHTGLRTILDDNLAVPLRNPATLVQNCILFIGFRLADFTWYKSKLAPNSLSSNISEAMNTSPYLVACCEFDSSWKSVNFELHKSEYCVATNSQSYFLPAWRYALPFFLRHYQNYLVPNCTVINFTIFLLLAESSTYSLLFCFRILIYPGMSFNQCKNLSEWHAMPYACRLSMRLILRLSDGYMPCFGPSFGCTNATTDWCCSSGSICQVLVKA